MNRSQTILTSGKDPKYFVMSASEWFKKKDGVQDAIVGDDWIATEVKLRLYVHRKSIAVFTAEPE